MTSATTTNLDGLTGLTDLAVLAGCSIHTIHKATAELAARGLIRKINGSWVAEARNAVLIAEVAKSLRRVGARSC